MSTLRLPPSALDLPAYLRSLVAQVPAGRVTTPGGLAAALGNPIAARWIGAYHRHHSHDKLCPCHRIVRAGGRLTDYAGGTAAQQARLLKAEGIEIREGAIDMARYGFDDFVSDRPLTALARLQDELAAEVDVSRRRVQPRLVGGVDTSYASPEEGVAAYTLVDTASGELVWSTTVRRPVRFPYITSYLTFRELPILLELLDEVRRAKRLAPVVLVDGTGILHPRRVGIASHLGVVARVPTIGVTKKLLCGQVDIDEMRPLVDARPVVYRGQTLGVAIRPTAGSRRPIFISPGHRIDLAGAERLVRQVLTGRRLPEPLYWADRLSRQHAKPM